MDASEVRAERAALLELRRARGLTYEDLAEMTGLSPATWRWWERRLAREARAAPQAKGPKPRFTELQVRGEAATGAWAFEIEVGGRLVRVAPGFEGAALARLLETLA